MLEDEITKAIFLLEKLNQVKINQALELGANTIFVGHKNLTKDLAKKARSRGIKLYIEIGIFVGDEWWKKYPDSRPASRGGKPMEKIHWYAGVCPNQIGVRRERLGEIREMIGGYEVDGIWLDFIRYPCHWEKIKSVDITEYCFCPNCLQGFNKAVKTPRGWPEVSKKGTSPRKNPSGSEFLTRRVGELASESSWIQWKCDQIANFVSDVRTLINQSGKNIQLGMFSVPWKENEFGGAIKGIIGQDFKNLAKYIDIFSPMVYHKMCGRGQDWIYEIAAYMDEVTGKPVLPIIQTENKPTKISRKEFAEEIRQATSLPSSGAIVFFLEDLLKDDDKIEVVKEKFA